MISIKPITVAFAVLATLSFYLARIQHKRLVKTEWKQWLNVWVDPKELVENSIVSFTIMGIVLLIVTAISLWI